MNDKKIKIETENRNRVSSPVENFVSKKTAGSCLLLTLHKSAFEVMVTGEKDIEIRDKTDWIKSRLFNKDGSKRKYDIIKFINGYGRNKPYFVCEYKGFDNCNGMNWTYSNGLTLNFREDKWIIYLGKIIYRTDTASRFSC